jgi:alpha-glucosidase (family GH31 glycosyl hydrolase)
MDTVRVFHPFCRTHSPGHQWRTRTLSFGEEVVDITRKFVEIRYTNYYLFVHHVLAIRHR